MHDSPELDWLQPLHAHLRERMDSDTLTHAVMLAGRPGVGKRALADMLARQFLGASTTPGVDVVHPDLHRVSPLEGKAQISVDQVRELTSELALSAHGPAGKVAIIEPADTMTVAAANSLLKTLEEPSGNSLLLLVADRSGRLPATITSRTTVYQVLPPARPEALRWLQAAGVAADDAADALDAADGAPLAALAMSEAGQLEIVRQVARDVQGMLAGRNKPLAVAAGWQKMPHELVLAALRRTTMQLIRATMSQKLRAASDFQRYVVDTRDAFCYLDAINRLIARLPGSYNPDLALEILAMPWANALRDAGRLTDAA